MSIYLGNLNVNEIENRAGITFPKELKEYMIPRKQDNASNISKGKWHCFDIPFLLVCGDIETATKIHSYLKDFSSDFKESLNISITK